MSDHPAARRFRLLEELREHNGKELGEYARRLQVDERTIRRDVDTLQDLISTVQGIEVRRGHLFASRQGYAAGYFTGQLDSRREAKEAIARAIVRTLPDHAAVVVTAGTTTYSVAREIRRAALEDEPPHGLVAFTNSLPALMELIAGGVATGVVGEVFNPDDCAFHSHELCSGFHPAVAVVGASGAVADGAAGTLDLFTHRAEEAAFMKQLLARVPEVVVALDATKVGRRHPWSFTDNGALAGKTVRLVTDALTDSQRQPLDELAANNSRFSFEYQEVAT